MERLGELYGIDRSEMIAVGDGYNDLSMLEYAGLGAAMGNAPQDVKNKADIVVPSNDDNGVAYLIEKYILQQEDK
jgi:hydroxymethylpyrimidine pyrophosphatase-like HAD family hydrolase